jgi:undecaprenyl phosphate-alpha-L-ara4FN deformylase
MTETTLGLKIDVDTYRGTQIGVPSLCRVLDEHCLAATFFFSVGPDNMGRHVVRLLRPAFLKKMLRSNAPALYGWDILLRGLLGPGPVIGEQLGDPIRAARRQGHEIGLHAWDHHAWQRRIEKMSAAQIGDHLRSGVELLTRAAGTAPVCSAAPAWKCTPAVITAKEKYPFRYNSDCRGTSLFKPLVNGRVASQPQIPTTLPTYDEVIGSGGVTDAAYNDRLLARIRPGQLNVLTIHAEVEGISRCDLFRRFLAAALQRRIRIVPLGELLAEPFDGDTATVSPREIPGRDGWVSCQTNASVR